MLNTIQGTEDVTSIDQVQDLVIDDLGNIYITGYAGAAGEGYNMYTMKLDDDLNLLWDDSYNYSGSYDDRAYGMALDGSGNVIVTGCSDLGSGNTQFTTLKYNSTGTLQWTATEDISNSGDTARAVVVDANNNIYISGSFSNGSNQDIKTIKYSDGGSKKWEIDFNGTANGDEYILDMTIDGTDIIVTTQTWTGLNYKYATIKYGELQYSDLSFSSTEQINGIAFIKNNGQLRDTSGTGHSSVKYMSRHGSYFSYYKDDGFEWMRRTAYMDSTMSDTLHKVDFSFVNPENDLKVRPLERSGFIENYYIPYGLKRYERVPVYGKLLYKNVWEDIDMETCLTQDKELRFTVNKGGKISDIELNISGADSLVKNSNGTVSVHFFDGEVILPGVIAYQKDLNNDWVEMLWDPALKISGTTLSLDSIGSYDANEPIVFRIGKSGGTITETDGFCHSTYYGSVSTDRIYGSTVDSNDNLAVCGVSANTSLYEDGNGIVQIPPNGNFTGQSFIQKFDSDFVPLFLSIVNGNGNIFLGQTEYTDGLFYAVGVAGANNIPTENQIGADFFDGTNNLVNKGYIAAFNEIFGELEYSSYFGSLTSASGWDEQNEIYDLGFDSNGNLFITGQAVMSPTTDFPFNNDISAPYYDESNAGLIGYIARFDSNMDLEWCTQVGSSNILGTVRTRILDLDISEDDQLAVAGWYKGSTSFIPAVLNTVQNLTIGGNTDWFTSVFDPNGSFVWGTYEGSDDDEEGGSGISGVRVEFSEDDGLFLAANLKSVDGISFEEADGGYFNDSDNGISPSGVNNYAMIVSYKSGFSYTILWRSLIMDGNRQNRINDLNYISGDLHIVGYTEDESLDLEQEFTSVYSSSSTPTFPGSSASEDGYYIKFDLSHEMLHSTYFGGEQSDEIRCIEVNSIGEVFGFGESNSVYDPDQDGIPVADNDISGRWYQENYVSIGNSDDAFGFKFCPGQILSTENEFEDQTNVLIVYPNPSIDGNILIDLPTTCSVPFEAEVFDMTGKLVFQTKSLNISGNGNTARIDLDLVSGTYILRSKGCGSVYQNKLVILE